jgi:hypothetical protein
MLLMEDKFVGESRHRPTRDGTRIDNALEKATKDPSFIDESVALLREFKFPAFKDSLVSHVREIGASEETVSLFESLDGYIEYRDLHHVHKSIEESTGVRKMEYQITDETRTRPVFRTKQKVRGVSIKDREAPNEKEERKDYPEVAPSATSDFICGVCGKPFQNQHDLIKHRQFESGTNDLIRK